MGKPRKNPLKKALRKLPPNYPVGSLLVNGAVQEVAAFSNVSGDVAYFINADCAVTMVNANKIDAMNFGEADPGDVGGAD